MRIQASITYMLLMLMLWSCSKGDHGVCISSAGKPAQESRELSAFTKLKVYNKINVEFYPHSGRNAAELSGPANLLEGCYTKVENGILEIGNHNKCNWLRNYDKQVTLKIYGDKIDEFTFYGGGDLEFKDTLHCDQFLFLSWESSGDVKLLLDARETFIKLNTGTTDVTLLGRSDYLYYYSLTTGFIFGKDFDCRESLVIQRGYGDLYINPTGFIKGEITKRGDVYYPGNIKADVNVTGTGRLKVFEQ